MAIYRVSGNRWNGSTFVFVTLTSVDIPGAIAGIVNYFSAVIVAPNTTAYLIKIKDIEPISGVRWQLGSVNISAIPDDVACDCLNGNCIPASQFNTLGFYKSVAACQAGCAKNSPCTGECVPLADIAELKAATSRLRSIFCG